MSTPDHLPPTPQTPVDLTRGKGETAEAWLGRVATGYYRLLFATAIGILKKPQDAEDAVQRATLKALQKCEQIDEGKAVVSWLMTITRNTALDMIRKQKRRAGMLDMQEVVLPETAPDTTWHMDDDMRQLILEAMESLPDNQRQAVLLRHMQGLEVSEIAKLENITPNNARVRLSRAYHTLRANQRLQKAFGFIPDIPESVDATD